MHKLRWATGLCLCAGSLASAQTSRTVISKTAAEHAALLADTGHCQEALPQLSRALGHIQENDLKRKVGVAGVKCSMAANDVSRAVSFLVSLNREFPHDAEVLYLSSHVYSDLLSELRTSCSRLLQRSPRFAS